MKNKKGLGVSAVIGVILMVAITVAIAGTVYIYVTMQLEQNGESEYIYMNGTLWGFYDDPRIDPIILDGIPIYVRQFHTEDRTYLANFVGQNITLILEPYDGAFSDYDYTYIGAYLNLGD
jgi:hypothetical protein